MNRHPSVVLFDLDGTVVDSADCILASLEGAFAANGLPWVEPDVAKSLLGPPFYESLPPLVGDDLLWPVIEAYRVRYEQAMVQAPVYDGVADLLAALNADGRRIAVASSKPEPNVRAILEHHGLADRFETIGGDTFDGSRGTKAKVIDVVLDRMGRPERSSVGDVVMVGDRRHDVHGAREWGIDCVGVTWGYAAEGELEEAGAVAICADAAALGRALGLTA